MSWCDGCGQPVSFSGFCGDSCDREDRRLLRGRYGDVKGSPENTVWINDLCGALHPVPSERICEVCGELVATDESLGGNRKERFRRYGVSFQEIGVCECCKTKIVKAFEVRRLGRGIGGAK